METRDLPEAMRVFVRFRDEHLDGDEKGEAQVFLDRLFQAFGHAGIHEAGGKLEHRVKKRDHGGTAFADLVWRPRVLIEMKKAGEDLSRHYQQAFEYWIDLVPDRPEYVVLCNFDEFWIYDLNRQLDEPVDRVALSDLPRRWEALGFLLPQATTPVFANDLVEVTREAAATVVRVTNALIERGIGRPEAQAFTMQSVMAMFSEDIGLLPAHAFTRAIEDSADGGSAYDLIFGLFREMNTPGVTGGGRFEGTPYFNGGLFRSINAFELEPVELHALHTAAASFDWSAVRPEIFGTLFEQSMGTDERHAYGAHFTSGVDIQRVVLPTIVRPWRDRIEEASSAKAVGQVEADLLRFRVLDPACGCGNFLYVAYRELRKLEKELEAKRQRYLPSKRGASRLSLVSTKQFFGIDIDPFAVEVARLTMMLGKELAAVELGDHQEILPLDDLSDNIVQGDALFMDWPRFDACIGNPPYLGRRKIVQERGASYAAQLDEAFPAVKGVSDYVVYWFQLAQHRLPEGGRAGLVATNTVRQTATRKASLDYVIDHGGTIVDAWSTIPWSGDAAVYVSIVNWVNGATDQERVLWLDEGNQRVEVPEINGSLATGVDLRSAVDLPQNKKPKVLFQGQTPGHMGFVVSVAQARRMIERDARSEEVLFPYISGEELLHQGEPGRWVIDFPQNDPVEAEAFAPVPFDHLRQLVLPDRKAKAEEEERRNTEALSANPKARVNWHHRNFLARWWKHAYRREDLLAAMASKDRIIALAATASENRRPVFEYIPTSWHPSHAVQCFTWSDDYHFGVLHSSLHEMWFRARCSTLEERLRYTSTTVFNSFPWPLDPDGAHVSRIEDLVRDLVELRGRYKKFGRSLAQQYNSLNDPGKNPLRDVHDALDEAVVALYGFEPSGDLLDQTLQLNRRLAE